jgi:ferrous iron transport protein A
MSKGEFVSLDRLPSGAAGIVRGLSGGRGFASRLAALGLSIGSEVQMLQNRGNGPLLVLVRHTRIALGRGEAVKIHVGELEGEQRSEH